MADATPRQEALDGFLLTFPVLVELPKGTSPDNPESPVWELAERIQSAVNQLVEADREIAGPAASERPDLGCHQVVLRELDPGRFNCGRCGVCGAWTTDWLKPDRIDALRRGMVVDGRLLCEDELDERQMLRLYPPG